MIYCVIPRELEAELFEKMVDYYKDNPNVTVIVDRREGPNRRQGKSLRRQARDPRPSPGAHSGHVPGDQRSRLTSAAWQLRASRPSRTSSAASGSTPSRARPSSRPAPPTGETLGVFPRSVPEDVDRAVAVAKEAFAEWRLVPAPQRGEILFRFAQLMAEHKAELTDLMTHEMGKVKAEAGGDVQEAIDMSFYMAGEGRRLWGQTTPSELRDKFNMSVRMPIGVVGVITPWNFPIAIPSWKIAPALVSGNTVVFKPATDTPLLGERFVELLVEAGVPAGVINVVHGGGGRSAIGSSVIPTCR